MVFNKKDLKYSHYSWTHVGSDNPAQIGSPDSNLLNRNEGYEILSFVNHFMIEYSLERPVTFHKIERLIYENLPSNIRSREAIRKWLLENWKKY